MANIDYNKNEFLAAIVALCLLYLLSSCKKDENTSREHTVSGSIFDRNEFDEYRSFYPAWDSLSGGMKFLKGPSKSPFIDFRVNTKVFLQTEGSTEWVQLPYVKPQSIDSSGNPVLFYTVKLEYDWILQNTIVYIYAKPSASIDFSKSAAMSIRKYR